MEEQENRDLIDHRDDTVATTSDTMPTIVLTPSRIDNIRNEHYGKSRQVSEMLHNRKY